MSPYLLNHLIDEKMLFTSPLPLYVMDVSVLKFLKRGKCCDEIQQLPFQCLSGRVEK